MFGGKKESDGFPKVCVFAVFDTKAQYYGLPFMMRNRGEAIRSFSDAVNNVGNPNPQQINVWAQHPEDYVLFHIGYYDEATGKLHSLSAPESLGVGTEFIQVSKPDLKVL